MQERPDVNGAKTGKNPAYNVVTNIQTLAHTHMRRSNDNSWIGRCLFDRMVHHSHIHMCR